MGSAGLWPRAGKSFAAKGLRADDGTNLVAVHIHVSDPHPASHFINRAFNARMQAKGKAKARGIQRVTYLGDAVSGKAHHMQDGTEYFAFQRSNGLQLIGRRRNKGAMWRACKPGSGKSRMVFACFAICAL